MICCFFVVQSETHKKVTSTYVNCW